MPVEGPSVVGPKPRVVATLKRSRTGARSGDAEVCAQPRRKLGALGRKARYRRARRLAAGGARSEQLVESFSEVRPPELLERIHLEQKRCGGDGDLPAQDLRAKVGGVGEPVLDDGVARARERLRRPTRRGA